MFIVQRRPTIETLRGLTTFGDLLVRDYLKPEHKFCDTLEDAIRAIKIPDETCAPAGRYELRFRNSPHFGPDTIELVDVPGFSDVLMHGGTDNKSTRGCIIVGDMINEREGTISGAKLRSVLDKLKQLVRDEIERDGRAWLEVRDPVAAQGAPDASGAT